MDKLRKLGELEGFDIDDGSTLELDDEDVRFKDASGRTQGYNKKTGFLDRWDAGAPIHIDDVIKHSSRRSENRLNDLFKNEFFANANTPEEAQDAYLSSKSKYLEGYPKAFAMKAFGGDNANAYDRLDFDFGKKYGSWDDIFRHFKRIKGI